MSIGKKKTSDHRLFVVSVFDRVAGSFSNPVCQVSQATAERWFNDVVRQLPGSASDYELYAIGDWCTDTGDFVACKPRFVLRGAVQDG